MRNAETSLASLQPAGGLMRQHCSFVVSFAIRAGGVIASALLLTRCIDSTGPLRNLRPEFPLVPTKYLVTVSKTTAAAGDTIAVQAQLVDAKEQVVPKAAKVVSWYVPDGNGQVVVDKTATDGNGIAINRFIAGQRANVTSEIRVVDDTQLRGDAPPIAIVAGLPAAYTVTPSAVSGEVGTTVSVTAQLTDKYGNVTPVAGRVVTWSVNTGDPYYYEVAPASQRRKQVAARSQSRKFAPEMRTSRILATNRPQRAVSAGTFSAPTSTTNSQGVATVNFTIDGSAYTSYFVQAQDEQGAVGTSKAITVQPGPIAKFEITVSVVDPPAGAAVIIRALARDASGTSINKAGEQVYWSVTGGGILSATTTTTDASGITSTVLTTSSTAGTNYTVTATNGQSATGTSPTITTGEQFSLAAMATELGAASTCGIATDSRMWCWGSRPGEARPVPGKPIGDQRVSGVTMGDSFNCAIAAGTVMCWGANGVGQLGDGTKTSHATPVPINSSLSYATVSAGPDHACALTTAGD